MRFIVKMDYHDLRLIFLVQILTILLVVKSIASTYFATYYALHNQEEVILEYAQQLSYLSFALLIPLVLIALNLIIPMSEKKKKYFDIISVIIIFILLIICFMI